MMYDYKYGTVGAVALDQHGNLAAGTSTGGMTNKRYGRVGDSLLSVQVIMRIMKRLRYRQQDQVKCLLER